MRNSLLIAIILTAASLSNATLCWADDDTNTSVALKTNLDFHLQLTRKQEPIGSITSYSRTTNSEGQISIHFTNQTSGSNWIVDGGPVPIPLPHIYKAPTLGITFEVESDGRHVIATDNKWKMLWRRDPFADSKLEFYRTQTPRVVYIRELSKSDEPHQWIRKAMESRQITNFICINFNSSQFGCLNVRNGDFTFLGQR